MKNDAQLGQGRKPGWRTITICIQQFITMSIIESTLVFITQDLAHKKEKTPSNIYVSAHKRSGREQCLINEAG